MKSTRCLSRYSQMKSGANTRSGTFRTAILYTLLLLTSGAAMDTMATVTPPPAGTETVPVDGTVDRNEVAIRFHIVVTTTDTENTPRLPMVAAGNDGLNRFLDATRSPETPGIIQPGLAQTFGVAPPSKAELHGTLTLSATSVDRQTPLSSFAADALSLAEAVAASCIDPASTDACVETPTLSIRLPEQTDSGMELPTPVLSVLAATAFGFTAVYRSRRAKPLKRKLSRGSGPARFDRGSNTTLSKSAQPSASRLLRDPPTRNQNNPNTRVSMTRNDISTPA